MFCCSMFFLIAKGSYAEDDFNFGYQIEKILLQNYHLLCFWLSHKVPMKYM